MASMMAWAISLTCFLGSVFGFWVVFLGSLFIRVLPIVDKRFEIGIGHSIIDVGQGSVEKLPAGLEDGFLVRLVAWKHRRFILNLAQAAAAFFHIVQL